MARKENIQDLAVAEILPAEKTKEDLRKALNEIKEKPDVVGYILRNSTSAAIDLKDPSKLIDYAILSSSALETGEELAEIFELGKIKNVVIEGGTVNVLSTSIDENKVSIFLEKTANYEKILRNLLSL